MKSILIKILLGLLITISIILNVAILYLSYSEKKEKEKETYYQEIGDSVSSLRDCGRYKFMVESQKILIPLLYNLEGKPIPMNTIIKEQKKILFIPQNVCMTCRNAVLLSIKELKLFTERKNLIILFEASNERELQLIKSKYKLPGDVLFSINENLNIRSGGNPFFFTLDEHNSIQHFFLAEPHNLFILNDYLTFSGNLKTL